MDKALIYVTLIIVDQLLDFFVLCFTHFFEFLRTTPSTSIINRHLLTLLAFCEHQQHQTTSIN
jgi:hypothetical protein